MNPIPGATYEPPGRAIPRFGGWNMKLALTAAVAALALSACAPRPGGNKAGDIAASKGKILALEARVAACGGR